MNLPGPIITETNSRAPKGIVYGPPGVGKTTFGSNCGRALLVDCENGAAYVQCDRTPYLATWQEMAAWLDSLGHGQHEYEAVVIDSIDWMLRRIEEKVAGTTDSESGLAQTMNKSHGGYGNGKQVLKNYVYRYLLPRLDAIVNRGVAVILLAHSTRREITTIDGTTMEKSSPEIHEALANTMIEWSDFVGCARLVGGARELILNETAQHVAKNRYGIAEDLALDWSALCSAMFPAQPEPEAPAEQPAAVEQA